MEKLRYYVAHNRGMQVLDSSSGGSLQPVGSFFEGRTVEHLTGPKNKPEIVFAAVAFDGGYRTRDAGKTWEKIMEGDVRTFTVDPHDERVVYMGIGPIRLFRSEDLGTTWEPLDGMLDFPPAVTQKWGVPAILQDVEHPHVRYVFVHPDDRQMVWVLLEHGGVLLSRDGGKTWDDRSTGIDYVDMHMIENYPGSKERYCVSSARGFFRSDDCGLHWYRTENGMPWGGHPVYSYSHEWKFLNADGPRMIVCGSKGSPGVWGPQKNNPEGHLMVSDDGGDHWRIVTHGTDKWAPWSLASHPSDAKKLFCGMGNGARGYYIDNSVRGEGALYVSPDNGESWEPLMTDLPSVLITWVAPN
jgi:hypothetical protein